MPCSWCGRRFTLQHLWQCRVFGWSGSPSHAPRVHVELLCDECRDAWLEREGTISWLAEPDLVPA